MYYRKSDKIRLRVKEWKKICPAKNQVAWGPRLKVSVSDQMNVKAKDRKLGDAGASALKTSTIQSQYLKFKHLCTEQALKHRTEHYQEEKETSDRRRVAEERFSGCRCFLITQLNLMMRWPSGWHAWVTELTAQLMRMSRRLQTSPSLHRCRDEVRKSMERKRAVPGPQHQHRLETS